MNRRTFWMFALGLTLGLPASLTFAQNRQGGGNFDPAQFRERMMNDLKDQLAATPEEWTVIQPKLEKVMTASRNAMAGRTGGMRFGRSGSDRGSDRGGNRPSVGSDSPAGKAASELRDAVEKKDTPQEEIATKLKNLREAKAKAKAELETAQKDLQSVLTPRQEAVLVANGMLE
jgi:hypothetical protein